MGGFVPRASDRPATFCRANAILNLWTREHQSAGESLVHAGVSYPSDDQYSPCTTGRERRVMYESDLPALPAAPPELPAARQAVRWILYSSGTTGRPKGVELTQANLIAHTVNAHEGFEFDEGDKNMVSMPLFHVGGSSYVLFGIHDGILDDAGRSLTRTKSRESA